MDALLTQIQDRHLRRLLRGVPDGQAAQLGVTTHIELYKEMLQAAQCPNASIVEDMLHGFRIVGKIRPSGRWPPYEKAQEVLSVSDALARAWEIRKKIVRRVAAVQRSDNLRVIWEATLEDVLEGSCLGPLGSEREVSDLVQADDWIPTQRFEVVQKNKVRGCDSATTNMINKITEISEKLQLPSTDYNVAVIRELCSRLAKGSSPSLEGWVLGEKKAYRQIPIHPSRRKFSVICLKDPDDGKVKFFVVVGHSFGLVSAVYNYNCRSAAINDILVNLFSLVAFNFYDDKYGFEPSHSCALAHDVAQKVHWWLGAAFDVKKLQRSKRPDVLGVTYNLEEFKLEIQEKRRAELKETIEDILQKESLDPGSAGKLKGKLMFGASQLWGKVGRAFLRSLSERQYLKHARDDSFALNSALLLSLFQWLKLVQDGPPRPIEEQKLKKSDAVLFTDGFTPDARKNEKGLDRIGGVVFSRGQSKPYQFTAVVPERIEKFWLVRKTQIVPIEMLAPIVALSTFGPMIRGKDIILFIDSEAVEGALIKGYSAREDLSELVSVFWDLALELRVNVYIDRVSTDANPADWPSRNDLETGRSAGWGSLEPVWPSIVRGLGRKP